MSPEFRSSELYTSAHDKILKQDFNEGRLKNPPRNLIFVRNLTTNQPIDLRAYDRYFFSAELIRPLDHLSSDIKSLCFINYEKREAWVREKLEELEVYLGKPIEVIDDKEIHRRGINGEFFDLYLPIGETTLITSPYVQILQNSYDTPHKTFKAFHEEYYSAHHRQNLRKCSSFHDFSPQYVPETPAEKRCYERLLYFLKNEIQGYEKDRGRISPTHTSNLSRYFALGIISFEHLIEVVHQHLESGDDYKEFDRQCHWILYCKLRARKIIDKNLPPPLTPEQQESFLRWADGEVPERNQVDWVINHHMRRLKAGEQVSNRFRMMATYYLVKHLGIDWRYGEFYMRCSLVDGHPLINYYNWHYQCNRNRFFANYNLSRQVAEWGDKPLLRS